MGTAICSIDDILGDDPLRVILRKLEKKDKEKFGLVCKKWLWLQSTEPMKLAPPLGLRNLWKLAIRFPRVVELDLSNSVFSSSSPGFTDHHLQVVARGFRGLRILNLRKCGGISDDGMEAIGGVLVSLQSLDVSYCGKLTDKGLSAIAKGCLDLRSLHLAGCRFVTDKTLQALSKNCHRLEELGVQGCTGLTDYGLNELVRGCPRTCIKFLDVN